MTSSSTVVNGIPTIEIEGDAVKSYNKASAAQVAADLEMKKLRPVIIEFCVGEILKRNAEHPKQPTLTVNLLAEEDGERLQVRYTGKYSQISAEAADDLFDSLVLPDGTPADANKYVAEVVVGKFDCAVFLGDDKKFSQKKYDAYRKAIEAVAKQFDDVCPLSTTKVTVPLDDFHEKRWAAFPSEDDQRTIMKAIPNVISLHPQPNVEVAAEAAPAINGKKKSS